MDQLRVLELYSGIGGMHYALKESSVPAEVVAAVDVNTTANVIYKHNFTNTPLLPKTIEGMTLQDFDKLNVDMILMSPPCQPFTRLSKRPQFVLLENVKGFETSAARDALLNTLRQCDYSFQEFLITPTHIMEGFPRPVSSESSDRPAVPNNLPTPSDSESKRSEPIIFKMETAQESERKRNQDSQETVRRLQEYLREEDDMDQYLLPPKTLLRYALLMDMVQPSSRRSVCFTKGYGHYVEGTGSVLQSSVDVDLESVFKSLELLSDEDKLTKLLRLKLRYFTPREIANLMGFPEDFSKA
ncbi:tRNA (cytosine(38)-C(5))-methyltransferase [Triplophysa tibetana]|uniref:tRNA (Cytosine(38)-C(5))-methyltransferase n=1 Tax=Triplophysa tibetana TaxID=1572043 RepID=A0A5A9N3X3_9TELE|nr:tRNA (cytosine(38)-C(5))-methyltransferase [Triplophysa tibetana]